MKQQQLLIFVLSFLVVLFGGMFIGVYIGQSRFPETMMSGTLWETTSEDHASGCGMGVSDDTATATDLQKDVSGETDISMAHPVEVVELQDGDTYDMAVTKVKKEIGNSEVTMLAYNGSVPGPVIKVAQNSHITLRFTNKAEDLETTLHSHGLRLDNRFDGVPVEMKGTQEMMKYGDTFEYQLYFPDAGIYWYHPHVREDMQQELGMYGNYLIEPESPDYWAPVHREETLILDDILMENDTIAPLSNQFANYVLMGRYGNTMLINGDANYHLEANKGEVLRLYLTNVSNTRPYNFSIPGVQMKLVGGDLGKYEHETFVESVTIAPAERYIVELYLPDTGTFAIKNTTPISDYTLGEIQVSDTAASEDYSLSFSTLRDNNDVIADIDRFRPHFDGEAQKQLTLTLAHVGMRGGMGMMGGMMHGEGDDEGIEWEDTMNAMNRTSTTNMLKWKMIDRDTKKENMEIDWKFKVGDVVKISIYNDPNSMHPMQHPIHFHGQRFLVIARDGVSEENLVWKDTAMVKTGETIDILLDVTNPGDWMAHCHIAEHLSAGMMMSYRVEEEELL